MIRSVIFSFLILLLPVKVFSQAIDSFRHLLQIETNDKKKPGIIANIAFTMSNTNIDSAMILARTAVKMAEDVKIDTVTAVAENSLGWCYFRSGKNDSALIHLEVARGLYHKANKNRGEARAMINLGTVYEADKNHEKALACILPAEKLFETTDDRKGQAYAEREIGVIYRELGQTEKAKIYLRSAVQSFKSLNDKLYTSDALSSLGRLYLDGKMFDSALYCYREALRLNQNENSISAAYAWDNVGDAFFQLSKSRSLHPYIDSALSYYNGSHDIFNKLKSPADVAYEDIKIGKCLHSLSKFPQAIQQLTVSLNYFRNDKEYEYAYEAAQELSQVYSSQGDLQPALKFLEESMTFKDSLDAANNKEQMANMFAKYEADKKDKTILLLNTQEKLSQQTISRQHIITLFILSLTLLGVFLAFIVWNRNRIKQQLKEVKMRNQLSSDLHDDIGSSLSSILLLSNMAAQKGEDERINKNLLERINNNAKEVIDRMSDIVWSMNPRYDEGESLRERIENYIAGLKQATTINICCNVDATIDQYHFTMELRKNIFLIIKEAMNNALKYANSTQLQLDFTAEEKYFLLQVKDNGRGFDKACTTAGNGFETMINRAKASDGVCDIISSPGNGTLVKAVIPIPNIR